MRNVKDWYIFIDTLVINRKKLYIYLENRFYTPDDALLTGIKAILAEEYSRELSKKIKNAHRARQKKGESILITNKTWGYNKINKDVVINEEEAAIIRLIFSLCLQGYGSRSISKELGNRGFKSRTGGHFPEITVRKIIRNPLFMGTAVMNKVSWDFNTKGTTHNPQEEWIYHENAVPAIISPEIWREANKLMDGRRSLDINNKAKGVNKGQYSLSSKILCGLCESPYWRRYRRRYKDKNEIVVDWSCSEYVKRGRHKGGTYKREYDQKVLTPCNGCDNSHVKEIDMMNILSEVAETVLSTKKSLIIEHVVDFMNEVFKDENINADKVKAQTQKDMVIAQKDALMDRLLDGTISNEDYKRRVVEFDEKLVKINNIYEDIAKKESEYKTTAERIEDIKTILEEGDDFNYKLQKLLKHIIKIVVFPDRLEIYLDFFDNLLDKITYIIKGEGVGKKYLFVDVAEDLRTVDYQVAKPRTGDKKFADDNANH